VCNVSDRRALPQGFGPGGPKTRPDSDQVSRGARSRNKDREAEAITDLRAGNAGSVTRDRHVQELHDEAQELCGYERLGNEPDARGPVSSSAFNCWTIASPFIPGMW
jgi:hypothetical protein